MAQPTLIPTEKTEPVPVVDTGQPLTAAGLIAAAPALAKALSTGDPTTTSRIALVVALAALAVVGGHELLGNRGFSDRIEKLEQGQARLREAAQSQLDMTLDHHEWSEEAMEAIANKLGVQLPERPKQRHVIRSIGQNLQAP